MSPLSKYRLEVLIGLSAVSLASSFAQHRFHRFQVHSVSNNPSYFHQRRNAPTSSSTELSVLIYGWDGDDDECSYTDVSTASDDLCSSVGIALAESLSTNRDKTASLARLAVAFSPPERSIGLNDIEHVQIQCVKENAIELEAVLCESHGCVSLFVPISFPHDCGPNATPDVLENCVLDNIKFLDMEAESVLGTIAQANAVAAANDELEDLEVLAQQAELPGWWLAPVGYDLVAECETITRLLNSPDFQSSVNDLGRKGLEALGLQDRYTIQRAVVSAVGPAGLCLKARVTSTMEPGMPVRVLDVPLPFGGDSKNDPTSLRAAVLGEVAGAQVS